MQTQITSMHVIADTHMQTAVDAQCGANKLMLLVHVALIYTRHVAQHKTARNTHQTKQCACDSVDKDYTK